MFTTRRLIVQPFIESDAHAFFEMSHEDGFNKYPITNYRQKDLTSARDWIRSQRGKFAVRTSADRKLIGMGGLTPWTWDGEEFFDITYRLREAAWGSGYGPELAEGLLKYGFEELKLPVITATITPDNIPSKKIAEKLGLTFDRHITLLGVPTDLYIIRK